MVQCVNSGKSFSKEWLDISYDKNEGERTVKKILLAGAMVLVVRGGVLLGQQAKPLAYTLKEATADMPLHAEWVVKVRSLGALRASINSVLATMGWQVLDSSTARPPLPALSMAAVMYPSADPNKRQGLFIDVDMDGATATIMADWYLVAGPSRPKAEAKKFYDMFFAKLDEALK